MILAVASGKGGTGKTTVAVNLALVAGTAINLFDCDVEAPNARLFLGAVEHAGEAPVSVLVPEVDESVCDGCGACSALCRWHAIVSFGDTRPLVFPEMCHGCGGCALVCRPRAIREVERRIGSVSTFRAGPVTLVEGRLEIGAAMSPPVIRAVKARLDPAVDAILDAPPGNSCPMVATVRGSDFVLLVTEPTPFGLNDLEIAVEAARATGVPFGVVINRAGIGDDRVARFCARIGVPVLAEIPDDRAIAEAYSRGVPLVAALPRYRPLFAALGERVRGLAAEAAARRAAKEAVVRG